MRRSRALVAALMFMAGATLAVPTAGAQSGDSEPTQVVVVPKSDLAKGATPTESSLEEKKIPVRLAPVNAVSGIAQVVGRTLKTAKLKGSVIVIDDLSNAGDPDNKPN